MQTIIKQVTLVWHNPYITDGLVAMWDGEWNAGGGIHDASATTWVDLTGNHRPLAIIPASSAYWKPQSITTEDTDCNIAYAFSSIGERCPFVSCEIVMRRRGNNWATLVCGGSSKYAVSLWNSKAVISKSTGGVAYAFTGKNDITQLYLGKDIFCQAGVPLTATGETMPNWPVCDTIAIGSCYNGTTGSANYENHNEIFCVRLYNRELTLDEISCNYAIDFTRFNIESNR